MAQTGWLTDIRLKWENACAYTRDVVQQMPEDALGFRPAEEMMTFEEQVLHLCRNANWLTTAYLEGDPHTADLKATGRGKAELLALLNEQESLTAVAMVRLEGADLSRQHDFFAGPMTTRQILLLLHDHMTHHRGQLIVYLRLRGVKPPAYRGW